MKKLLSLCLAAALCLLCACAGSADAPADVPSSPEAGLTPEQQLIADAVNETLQSEEFASWGALYKEFTGSEPNAPAITSALHYTIDDFDGEAIDCYLVNIDADTAHWIDEQAQQGSADERFQLYIDAQTGAVYNSIALDAPGFDGDTSTPEGKATYLLWIYGNAQTGDMVFVNDTETVTTLGETDIAAIAAALE